MMTTMMMMVEGPCIHTFFHKDEPGKVTALEGYSTEQCRDPVICPRNDPLLENLSIKMETVLE